MRGSPKGWGERLALCAGIGWLAVACAVPVSLADGRWRERTGGASIADLAALDASWRRAELAGPLLSFVGPDDARACWIRSCRGAAAPARAEAHALLISLDEVKVEQEGGVVLAGVESWALRARAVERGRAVQLAAVTRVAAGCTDDFLLVTPHDLAAHEPVFERWWASFEPGSRG